MLDIKYIRENVEQVKNAIQNKNLAGKVDLQELLRLDQEVKDLTLVLDDLRQQKNQIDTEMKKSPDQTTRQK